MVITLTLKDLLLSLIFIGLIILICYLVVLTKNLVRTVKETNKILEDAAVVSKIAADKAVEVDGIVDDVSSTISELGKVIKGNQSVVAAASNVVNAIGSLVTIFKKSQGKKE